MGDRVARVRNRGWGGLGVATGLAVDWDWEDLGLFVVVGLVMVDRACTCRGRAEAGGDDEGVMLVAAWLQVQHFQQQLLQPERSWERKLRVQTGLGAGGVGVAPWAGGSAVVVWTRGGLRGWLLGELWSNFGCCKVG